MLKIKNISLLIIIILGISALYAGYYDLATGSGETLKTQLRSIITTGHHALSYDGAKLKLFQEVFNVDGIVRCVYTGQDFTIASGYNGSTSPNTEHSYCQSWFGELETSAKKSDLHHLFPTVQNVNSSRGNMPLGIVVNHSSATSYPSYNDFHSYRGASSNGVAVFEPAEQYKGDFARALLYFSVRYNMGLTRDNVDMLPYLLTWHNSDPVDTFEQSRNEKNYTIQGNKNPFIDHPEWVSSIWQNSSVSNTQISFDVNTGKTHEGNNHYYLAVRINNPSETSQTSCRVTYSSGTASAVNNFTYQDISFPANNANTVFVPVTITDNDIIDGNRNVVFSLQNISGGNSASVGINSQFTLTVEDNDFTESGSSYATDLIISEYVEGSSSNKYLEIFNGTGSTVDLSNYQLELYPNGALTPNATVILSGLLAHNSVKIYRNSSAPNLENGYSSDTNSAVNYNGDDALVLRKISSNQIIDIFGRIGEDPGTAWVMTPNSTLDKTLVRKSSIKSGITANPSSGFPTLLSEWSCYNQNTFSYLGTHEMDYGQAGENAEIQAQLQIVELDTDYAFGNMSAISLNFSDLNSSGKIKIKKHRSEAQELGFSGNTPEFISNHRWVITKDTNILTFNCKLSIDLDELSSSDILNPYSINLYHRENENTGNFSLLGNMSYDSNEHILYFEDLTSFSEFILCSDSQTLPVTLSSFTANFHAELNNVQINWITQSETDLLGYKIFRNHQENYSTAIQISDLIIASNSSNIHTYNYTDNEVNEAVTYYWLCSYERDGASSIFGPISVNINLNNPQNPPDLVLKTSLNSIYPNPFNPSTTIAYSLREDSRSEFSFYNIKGQLIDQIKFPLQTKGLYSFNWHKSGLSSGIYFVRFTADHESQVKKIILIK